MKIYKITIGNTTITLPSNSLSGAIYTALKVSNAPENSISNIKIIG
jgi:hypothetical protein